MKSIDRRNSCSARNGYQMTSATMASTWRSKQHREVGNELGLGTRYWEAVHLLPCVTLTPQASNKVQVTPHVLLQNDRELRIDQAIQTTNVSLLFRSCHRRGIVKVIVLSGIMTDSLFTLKHVFYICYALRCRQTNSYFGNSKQDYNTLRIQTYNNF